MVKTYLNLKAKCRSCLSEDQEMHHLFSEFDQGLSLSDILRSTTYLEIEDNSELSPYLCESCTTIVVDFFNFKTIFIENNSNIKLFFTEKNVDDNEGCKEINKFSVEYAIKSGDCTEDTTKNAILENTQIIQISSTETDELDITRTFIEPRAVIKKEVSEDNSQPKNSEILNVRYYCNECGDRFLLKSGLQQHLTKRHNLSVCDIESYISKATIEVSEQIKDEDIILQCDTCNENFKTCAEIEEHYKSHKKYVCEHCGAGFLKKSYLNDHAEVHATEKRHVCPICGKAFKRRTVLVKHKKIHTHPKQCVCEICGLRFTDKGTLKTHIKLKHTKERNFNCTICGLWFPLKSTLMKHIYRHNDDRKREHVCTVCHMAYKDKSSLNRHVVIKHTENTTKPSCTFCGKQYTTNTNLLKHIRKHHKSLKELEYIE
ncbi:gastrula zinc finger protein XlCGF26.1-like [Anoplophora glabripennis]|uniref:gastrula zinc finger protein XlCGF26.1-like n=1 Tax=Anoplophora glabripennis TaxID=217634 RepID=UPI0008739880|nr:gastrula zinc finger protein XlCGF26.1-like [Anoplophora glabripennis]